MPPLQQPKPVAAPKPNRMTLTSIIRNLPSAPTRTVLYSPEGFGKSTFGAEAMNPIFIAAEDGIRDVVPKPPVFPEPKTLDDVYDAVAVLQNGEHDFKTLVLDTADFIEALIHRDLCLRDGVTNLSKFGGGYNKGQDAALEEWRILLGRLDRLRLDRGMEIIILAHSQTTTFDDPAGPSYARYELAVNKKAAGLLKAWADVVLFGLFETATTDPKKGKIKGVGGSVRVVHTERSAAFDAKNRKNLPPTLSLSYAEYVEAIADGLQVDNSDVLTACRELIEKLELPATHKAVAVVEANKDNPSMLVKALNRLRALSDETEKVKE